MKESITQNLVRLLHNDKGFRINLCNKIFQFCNLLLFDSGQNHLSLVSAVSPLTMEVGRTSVELQPHLMGNLGVFFGNNPDHFGIIKALYHHIDHLSGDKNGNAAV